MLSISLPINLFALSGAVFTVTSLYGPFGYAIVFSDLYVGN